MLTFFPTEEEVRLVSLSEAQLHDNLGKYIEPVGKDKQNFTGQSGLFTGVWNERGFSISLKLKISNNFVPVINGDIIKSEEGLLIRSRFSLFPATKRLLLFWTVLSILITLFFVGLYQAWLYGAISFGFCIVNYVLARENFKIQVRKSKRMLEKMFSAVETN